MRTLNHFFYVDTNDKHMQREIPSRNKENVNGDSMAGRIHMYNKPERVVSVHHKYVDLCLV